MCVLAPCRAHVCANMTHPPQPPCSQELLSSCASLPLARRPFPTPCGSHRGRCIASTRAAPRAPQTGGLSRVNCPKGLTYYPSLPLTLHRPKRCPRGAPASWRLPPDPGTPIGLRSFPPFHAQPLCGQRLRQSAARAPSRLALPCPTCLKPARWRGACTPGCLGGRTRPHRWRSHLHPAICHAAAP
jgi:hypothetical protein